jgi:prolyl oligopeptidase
MFKYISNAVIAFLYLLTSINSAMAQTEPPIAPVHNVTDEYFGTKVVDPYRWMEKAKDPEFSHYLKGQADYARKVLDSLPLRKELLDRINNLDDAQFSDIRQIKRIPNDKYLYLKTPPNEQTQKLYLREGLNGAETLLIDPDKFSTDKVRYAISYFVMSPDGKYIAYGVSPNGSEQITLRIFEVAAGRNLNETIDRMDWEYSQPEWRPDSRSFFYTRLQKLPSHAPATENLKKKRAFLHVIDTDPESDKPVFGIGSSPKVRIEETDTPIIYTSKDTQSPYAIGMLKHGDANEVSLYSAPLTTLNKSNVPWRKISDRSDLVNQFVTHDDSIFLITSKDAPRFKIIRTSLSKPDLNQAATVVAQSKDVITGMSPTLDALYVTQLSGGLEQVLRVDWRGKSKPELVKAPAAPSSSVYDTNHRLPGALIGTSSWTASGVLYLYEPKTKGFTDTGFIKKHPLEATANLESREVLVKSHDGVMVPLSIVYKRGLKLDGSNPTLLFGYGSYGIIDYPFFHPFLLAWFERGGVYAVGHIRGGGAYGKEWHLAGQKLNKPNSWKDFIVVAEYLIAQKYTSPKHLAGQSGSAGGVLIGRAITERPDLFAAAIINYGFLDMLRNETTANGVPNIQEFGTVKDPAGFRGLYQMSAFHHVKDNTPYPAVLLTVGANDPRVDVWHSAKMAARLQAASTSGRLILLRVDYAGGHGNIGSTKEQLKEELADTFAFLFQQLR